MLIGWLAANKKYTGLQVASIVLELPPAPFLSLELLKLKSLFIRYQSFSSRQAS